MNEHNKRKLKILNFQIVDEIQLTEQFEIPVIRNNGIIPERIVSFRQINSVRKTDAGVHFFIDDYKFESLWRYPQRYLSRLSDFKCIFAPDFSVYWDMPFPMKLWNIYRSLSRYFFLLNIIIQTFFVVIHIFCLQKYKFSKDVNSHLHSVFSTIEIYLFEFYVAILKQF